MFEHEAGALLAHIADEAHEHAPNAEIVWHHTIHVHETGAAPLLVAGVVLVLVAVIGFLLRNWWEHRLRPAKAPNA
jgi:hypothetical protein